METGSADCTAPPNCPLCAAKLPDLASLSSHLLSFHPQDTFRCVACTDTVALFPTYTQAYQHSIQVHQVTLDLAIQSSLLLPGNLEHFVCKLCSKEEIFLTKEAVKLHLGTHSTFFAKKWVTNSARVCRICEVFLGEVALEEHLTDKHPMENFADFNDIEDSPVPYKKISVSRKEAKPTYTEEKIVTKRKENIHLPVCDENIINIKEIKPPPSADENIKTKRTNCKSHSYDEQIKLKSHSGNEQIKSKRKVAKKRKSRQVKSEDDPEVPHKIGVCSGSVLDQEKLWNSFKPGNLLSKYFSSLPKSKIPTVTNSEEKNNDVSKAIGAFIKIEKVDDYTKPIKIKVEKVEDPKVDVKSKNIPSPKDPELEHDAISDKAKFNFAVIPLPCVDFPAQSHYSYQRMFYSCNVCTHSPIFESFSSWVRHRESKDHRYAYGKAFVRNDFTHFHDASFSTELSKIKRFTCWKCSTEFHNRWNLNLHFRTTHLRKKSFPIIEPYCHTCKMPILAYPGAPPHIEIHKMLLRESYACRMCDMRVYSSGLSQHNESAHVDQLFKCRLGQCGVSRQGDKDFQFGRALHLYPKWLIQHQARMHTHDEEGVLSSRSCNFPKSLVQISCRVCPYHFLGEDRDLMINHLKNAHYQDRRDLIHFSCRVCDLPGDTIADVIEHAKNHRDDKQSSNRKVLRNFPHLHSEHDHRGEESSEESNGECRSRGQSWYKKPYRDHRECYYQYRYRSSSSYSSRSDHQDRNSRYRAVYSRFRSRIWI